MPGGAVQGAGQVHRIVALASGPGMRAAERTVLWTLELGSAPARKGRF